MGFKCPLCNQDFGYDKKLWQNHCATEHDGLGKLTVNAIIEATMDNKNPHKWTANGGRGGEPRFSLDTRISDVPLMHVSCSQCGVQSRFTEKQWDDYNKNAASTLPDGK